MSNLAVAECFGRAAGQYDGHAEVQRRSGDRLLSQVNQPGRWMDLGTGTGYLAQGLLTKDRVTEPLLALDLSAGMLAQARQRLGAGKAATFIQADLHQLPLKNDLLDGVGANLVLQWSLQLPVALAEIGRVLKSGGQFLATMPLADSFPELRALTDAGQLQRQQLPQLERLEQDFRLMGWQEFRLIPFEEVVYFDTPKALLAHFKSTGAHHVDGRRPGLKGRNWWRQITEHLEAQRVWQGIPLTWQLVLCEARP